MIDGVPAGLALAAVVVEQAYRPTAEQQYGDEVAYGHYDHTEIDERPYEFDSHKRADEYEYAEYESICKYCLAAVFPTVAEESDIAFAVVVVADYAREGEEKYAYRHDEFACRADVVAERRLGEFYAVGATVVEAGAEYDQRGAGADDEGVGEDAKGLDRPCLTGWLMSAVAAAFGALPSPASLENMPRLKPINMAIPTAPPAA